MAAATVVVLALTGCAGMDSAMQYKDTPVKGFYYNGDDWRIFDKPRGRLMITPSIGRSMGEGALSGLTFGAADTDIPKPEYQAAVQAWLAQSGRKCSVTDGYKLIRPQWELRYECP